MCSCAVALAALTACGGGGDKNILILAEPTEQYVPPEPPSGYTAKAIQYANKDMVSAANPPAVQAGVDILAKGGSAIDAAIAVQMVLNLVEPQSSGICDGASMLHLDKGTSKILAHDGREMAPRAATADMFIVKDGRPLAFTSPRMNVSIAGSAARIKAQGDPGASYFLKADGTAKDSAWRSSAPQRTEHWTPTLYCETTRWPELQERPPGTLDQNTETKGNEVEA